MPQFFRSSRISVRACALLCFAASTVHAATYSGPLDKAEWADEVPSYIDMFIALPDVMPERPPILVNIHSCGNSAGGQWSYDGFAPLREAIDSVGFIMILPQQSRNCWNVGAPESLTHGGGGDTGAIVQMVQYALETYNGDPTRVYVMGGSGGGMTTQALLAVYPEVFKAGHARAGVPAGCWAEGYEDGMQWSDACAGGTVDKTPEEWGDYVRDINPDYTGPRPRVQLNHGNQDATIRFPNFSEAIDQWTNVLGLQREPTRTDSGYQGAAATYDRQFWDDDCGYTVLEAWEALNMGHSMGYESVAILEWFGLDEIREQDPWDAACGGMSEPGVGGSGAAGAAGASGMGGMGAAGGQVGTAGGGMATGGEVGAAGSGASGSPETGGGAGGSPTVPAAGGMPGGPTPPGSVPPAVTGAPATPDPAAGGAGPGVATPSGPSAGPVTQGANGGAGVSMNNAVSSDSGSEGGCRLGVGSQQGSRVPLALLALALVLRRRQKAIEASSR